MLDLKVLPDSRYSVPELQGEDSMLRFEKCGEGPLAFENGQA